MESEGYEYGFPLAPLERPNEIISKEINAAVCELAHVSRRDLLGRQREQHLASARQLAMFAHREVTTLSYPEIGRIFHRDHSTVIHAYNVIARMIRDYPQYARMVMLLLRQIEPAWEPNACKGCGRVAA